MYISQAIAEKLKSEGKYLTLLADQNAESLSFNELVSAHPESRERVADLINASFVPTIEEFEQRYAPNLAPLQDETDIEYDRRLTEYVEKRYFPATFKERRSSTREPDGKISSAKCIVCVDPFISEIDEFSDSVLVMVPHEIIEDVLKGARGEEKASIAPYSEDESIVAWFWKLVSSAYRQGAADIEITSHQSSMKVRMHIMGEWTDWVGSLPFVQRSAMLRTLCAAAVPPVDYEAGTVHDFKVERRIDGVDTSWRVSITPAALGDSVCLRSLPRIGRVPTLGELGYSEQVQRLFSKACRKLDGLVLVTGPTGSGKSTTLYSLMTSLRDEGKKIISAENPVELVVPGTVQLQVLDDEAIDEKYKVTFSSAVRTALRHKPDILVVGEMRDRETAHAAIGASRTGHLTFSTLHTTNVRTSVKRMIDLGIDPVSLSDVLTLVASQMLLPKLCPHCRVFHPEGGAERNKEGCQHCVGRGVVGKVIAYEVCYFDDEARSAITDNRLPEQFSRLEMLGLYIRKEDVLRALVAEGTIERKYMEDII